MRMRMNNKRANDMVDRIDGSPDAQDNDGFMFSQELGHGFTESPDRTLVYQLGPRPFPTSAKQAEAEYDHWVVALVRRPPIRPKPQPKTPSKTRLLKG